MGNSAKFLQKTKKLVVKKLKKCNFASGYTYSVAKNIRACYNNTREVKKHEVYRIDGTYHDGSE